MFWGFFKKLFKWVLVAVAVVVAVLTIIAAPATLVGILGAISAGANAASQVLNALGYRKAGLILGLIAIVTGFGSIIAAKTGVGSFASEGGQIALDGAWFGLQGGVGAVANFAQTRNRKRKNNKPPCPPSVQVLLKNAGLQEVFDLADELARISGKYKELGGWILAKEGSDKYTWAIHIDARNTSMKAYGLGEPNKHIGDLLKKGWYIIADFHTHGDSGGMNDVDESLSISRKTPGIVVQPGGKAVPYGVDKGIFGIGIPKGCK